MLWLYLNRYLYHYDQRWVFDSLGPRSSLTKDICQWHVYLLSWQWTTKLWRNMTGIIMLHIIIEQFGHFSLSHFFCHSENRNVSLVSDDRYRGAQYLNRETATSDQRFLRCERLLSQLRVFTPERKHIASKSRVKQPQLKPLTMTHTTFTFMWHLSQLPMEARPLSSSLISLSHISTSYWYSVCLYICTCS